MVKMIRKLILLLLVGVSQHAAATSVYYGLLRPHYWGQALYLTPIDSQITNKPACATRGLLRLEENDPSDPVYRDKLSMIMSAWLAGKKVEVRGNGTCSSEGDEYVFAIYLR